MRPSRRGRGHPGRGRWAGEEFEEVGRIGGGRGLDSKCGVCSGLTKYAGVPELGVCTYSWGFSCPLSLIRTHILLTILYKHSLLSLFDVSY